MFALMPCAFMKKKCNIALACLMPLLIAGCATGRLADLRDCGRLSVGLGLGVGAEASLGIIGNPSLGAVANKSMFGFDNRDCSGMWTETESFFPASSIISGVMNLISDGGPSTDPTFAPYARQIQMNIQHGKYLPRDRWIIQNRYRNFFIGLPHPGEQPTNSVFHAITDLEIGATAGIVAVRVGVNPLELLDFLLGFVGLDIAGDDPKKKAN